MILKQTKYAVLRDTSRLGMAGVEVLGLVGLVG